MKQAFADAIAKCIADWRDAHGRAPSAHELVHAFEVVVVGKPDDYVADPAAARALFLPTKPPVTLVPAYSATAKWEQYDGVDYLRLDLVEPRTGSLRCVFEHTGERLAIDYWRSIYPTPPSDADIRRYLARHALAAWRARFPGRVATCLLFRSIETLADPVEVDI